MEPILVVVADQARARIFLSETRVGQLLEVSDLANPEGRLHEGDLVTGETGQTSSRFGIAHSNYHPTTVENTALARSAERFAIAINEAMEKFVEKQRPTRIHVIAPPKFMGLLRAKWSKPVKMLIADEISKNVSAMDPEEIREHLPDYV